MGDSDHTRGMFPDMAGQVFKSQKIKNIYNFRNSLALVWRLVSDAPLSGQASKEFRVHQANAAFAISYSKKFEEVNSSGADEYPRGFF